MNAELKDRLVEDMGRAAESLSQKVASGEYPLLGKTARDIRRGGMFFSRLEPNGIQTGLYINSVRQRGLFSKANIYLECGKLLPPEQAYPFGKLSFHKGAQEHRTIALKHQEIMEELLPQLERELIMRGFKLFIDAQPYQEQPTLSALPVTRLDLE